MGRRRRAGRAGRRRSRRGCHGRRTGHPPGDGATAIDDGGRHRRDHGSGAAERGDAATAAEPGEQRPGVADHRRPAADDGRPPLARSRRQPARSPPPAAPLAMSPTSTGSAARRPERWRARSTSRGCGRRRRAGRWSAAHQVGDRDRSEQVAGDGRQGDPDGTAHRCQHGRSWPVWRRSTSCATDRAVTAMSHLATDRPDLRRTPGLALLAVARHRARVGHRTVGRPAPLGAVRRLGGRGGPRPLPRRIVGHPALVDGDGALARPAAADRRARLVAGCRRARRSGAGDDRGRIAVLTRADVRPTRVAGVPRAPGRSSAPSCRRRPACSPSSASARCPSVGWARSACGRTSTSMRALRHVAEPPRRRPPHAARNGGTARSCSPASSPTPAQARGTGAIRSLRERTRAGTIGTSMP